MEGNLNRVKPGAMWTLICIN